MGKKKLTFGAAQRAALLDRLDNQPAEARARRMTGGELRTGIDGWKVPYTRAAGWLGLSVAGLHKQMRGTHGVSLQTQLLFNNLDWTFRIEAKAFTEAERQHPDSPAFRSRLRAKIRRQQRELD